MSLTFSHNIFRKKWCKFPDAMCQALWNRFGFMKSSPGNLKAAVIYDIVFLILSAANKMFKLDKIKFSKRRANLNVVQQLLYFVMHKQICWNGAGFLKRKSTALRQTVIIHWLHMCANHYVLWKMKTRKKNYT